MIEFHNVSFAYPDSADGGLKNISMEQPYCIKKSPSRFPAQNQ